VRSTGVTLLALHIVLLSPAPALPQSEDAMPSGGLDIDGDASVLVKRLVLRVRPQVVEWLYTVENRDVTAATREVRLRLPDLSFDPAYFTHAHDFQAKLWVNDRPLQLPSPHRAVVEGGDVTQALLDAGLAPQSFAHMGDTRSPRGEDDSPELRALPAAQRDRLVALGALCEGFYGPGVLAPCWTLETVYRWRQPFPPRTPVVIRVAYRAKFGWRRLDGPKPPSSFCADDATAAAATARRGDVRPAEAIWHELLLGSLRARQKILPEFELVVEQPVGTLATVCWRTRVEKGASGELNARARDWAPPDVLKVAFIGASLP
jgi:hypothetical protein